MNSTAPMQTPAMFHLDSGSSRTSYSTSGTGRLPLRLRAGQTVETIRRLSFRKALMIVTLSA